MNEKFIYKSVVFFLILFACMNLPAESKEYAYSKHLPDTVFIFGGMYFPPLQYKEKTGYFFDDIRTLCNTAGIDFSIVVRPTKRLFKEMRQGQIDAWLGNKNAFTEEEINWLITPHMKIFYRRILY